MAGDPVNRFDPTGLYLVAGGGGGVGDVDGDEGDADDGSETESGYVSDGASPLVDNGTLVNPNDTSVNVTDALPQLGLVYGPPITTPTPGILVQLLNSIMSGIGGLATIFFASASTMGTGDVLSPPGLNPGWIEKYCTYVGTSAPDPAIQYPGGTSIEVQYLCPDGQYYWIHILTDKNGTVKEKHGRKYPKQMKPPAVTPQPARP